MYTSLQVIGKYVSLYMITYSGIRNRIVIIPRNVYVHDMYALYVIK